MMYIILIKYVKLLEIASKKSPWSGLFSRGGLRR